MDAIVITWRELLIAILLATLVYLFEVAIFSRRRRRKEQGEEREDAVVKELQQLRAEIATLKQRVEGIEAQIHPSLAERFAEDTPYGKAVRLAREGLTAQELANRCGISCGEAELIIALHRPLT